MHNDLQDFIENAAAIGKHGGDRRSENAPKPESPTKGGSGVAYLVARLKRDHPELLEEIGKGKRFPSVRAAALKAGIVRPSIQITPTTPEKLADDLRRRLPEEFWTQFVAAVTNSKFVANTNGGDQ